MNFFEHQANARKRTKILVFYYILALIALTVSFYSLIVFAISLTDDETATRLMQNAYFDPVLFFFTASGVLLLVGGASLFKTMELSAGGGDAVAQQMGGRLISTATTDPLERRLLNVVEEMAIASGVNVPNVYLLDNEPGINAFAAGFTPNTAALGINRGTIELLTRDELQGVLGHEFSHILNGDMRTNIRLISVLFGLNLIVIIGWFLMRITMYTNTGYRSSNNRDNNGAAAALIASIVGVGFVVLGSIGMFFSQLIQAAISRQREYLADASSVQFTRNPDGIAGALKKIGCPNIVEKIQTPGAGEASHMFFSSIYGVSSFSELMATHPPLVQRIQAIDPTFDGKFPASIQRIDARSIAFEPPPKPLGKITPNTPGGPKLGPISVLPMGSIDRVGQMDMRNLVFASALLGNIPDTLTPILQTPLGAKTILYTLLIDSRSEIRTKQLSILSQNEDHACLNTMQQVADQLKAIPLESRIPLAQKTLPSIRGLTSDQYVKFRKTMEMLVAADGQVDIFEYALRCLFISDLDVHFGLAKAPAGNISNAATAVQPLAVTLSYLAYSGRGDLQNGEKTAEDMAAIQKAFDSGMKTYGATAQMVPMDSSTLSSFDAAMKLLAEYAPAVKQKIIAAYLACASSDGEISVREGELLRAISATLDCPLPPFGKTA